MAAVLANYSAEITLMMQGQLLLTFNKQMLVKKIIDDSFVNWGAVENLTEDVDERISQPSENAIINDQGIIESGKPGIQLDRQVFKEQLVAKLFQNQFDQQLDVPINRVYPKVDSELLSTISANKIGYYITYFNSRNKERSVNIEIATEAINNHVIFPGETFSFNEVVGERTMEKGYKRAPIIVKGELTEGVGGGICQVSSTLFNAVDRAGVHIIKRYSHSKQVKYVPPGRDATVSWYGPDFTFQNRYHHPLLIQAKARNGAVVIQIFSSEEIEVKHKQTPDASKQLPDEMKREPS